MANTVIYQAEWEHALQVRLNANTTWKELCAVEYTDTQVINSPYIATASEPAVQTGPNRGSTYSIQDITQVNESVTINNRLSLPIFMDMADEAQSDYGKLMDLAELQGIKMNEKVEGVFLSNSADWTNFGDLGNGSFGLTATQITVSAGNVDDIIRGIWREVGKARGLNRMQREGLAFGWRYKDFEMLMAFMQANGFQTADMYLKDGVVPKISYMGAEHYVIDDTLATANVVFAGVKNTYALYILRSTFGRIDHILHPAGSSGGNLPGSLIYTEVDYAFKSWTHLKPILFVVNVAT